jgi:hypothetical protein
MARLLLVDVFAHLHEKDREYFSSSREQRLGITLEALCVVATNASSVFDKASSPGAPNLQYRTGSLHSIEIISLIVCTSGAGTQGNCASISSAAAPAGVPQATLAGKTITIENWRDYRDCMPDGMVASVRGKMPPDVQI